MAIQHWQGLKQHQELMLVFTGGPTLLRPDVWMCSYFSSSVSYVLFLLKGQ